MLRVTTFFDSWCMWQIVQYIETFLLKTTNRKRYMAYAISGDRRVIFKVMHLSQASSKWTFRTVVQQLARFLLTQSVARSLCNTLASRMSQWKKRKGKEEYLYSAFSHQGTHKALRHGSHSFTCKQHHACLSFVAFTRCHHHSNWGSRHPIAAHYSFIDPNSLK